MIYIEKVAHSNLSSYQRAEPRVAHSVLYVLFQHLLQIVHICAVVQKRNSTQTQKIVLRLKNCVGKKFAVQSAPFCSFIGDITVLALCFLLNKFKLRLQWINFIMTSPILPKLTSNVFLCFYKTQ